MELEQTPNYGPQRVAICFDGSLALVTDGYNYLIRRIEMTTSLVSFLAGSRLSGFANGIGTNAQFSFSKESPSRQMEVMRWSPILGTMEFGRLKLVQVLCHHWREFISRDRCGVGTSVYFNNPTGVTISPNGRFSLVTDTGNNMIRKIEGLHLASWLRVAEISCPLYHASDTDFARQNYVPCSFNYVRMNMCEISYCSTCVTDNYFRVYNSNGTEVLSGLSSCGSCVPLVYDYPNHVSCEMFTIHQGCNLHEVCSGEGILSINRNRIEDVEYEIAVDLQIPLL